MPACLVLFALIPVIYSQAPILPRPDGYVYHNGSPEAPIHMEAFIDLACPDCKTAWPILKKLADSYGPNKLRMTFHINPLVYHRQAYYAAMGVRALVAANVSVHDLFNYMDAVFKNQSEFYNKPTLKMSGLQVIQAYAKLAHKAAGISAMKFANALQNSGIDHTTRLSSKLAWERGVTGTPSFFINGIRVIGQSNWTVKQWKKVIDPLLKTKFPRLEL
ncbi:expressed hypothetical protein [Trichoplax adhaerens]|uniref:Thioredoxin-like fold domain-containing protein n=1 Tax=Trichoplax adhaerens TaxID=10228 RepID=B3S4F9_TRIAD|nr:expressed hypothetical protein [Trichoplax adhaerens]EDV22629.1 expressed hypothetical protein [Trichoplax adhaerens]|eukprot:XP_002115173.1 expressed hypothetical protein [Trichoplax adhaerens]